MTALFRLSVALALTGGFATGAGAQTRPSAKPPAISTPQAADPAPNEQIRTSDQLKRESVQGAATSPLRDLNVVKSDIPEILLQALNDPYERPPRNWKCSTLIKLVEPLDVALGPDIDRVPIGDENLLDRGRGTALGVAGSLASSAIPFRGVVRQLSGAADHDRLVQSAIIAGNVRRAYLKGLGEAKGCLPPATPSHERADVTTARIEDKSKPKYPTRLDGPQTPAGTPSSAPPK